LHSSAAEFSALIIAGELPERAAEWNFRIARKIWLPELVKSLKSGGGKETNSDESGEGWEERDEFAPRGFKRRVAIVRRR
jgi:hypothetical protein